QHLVDELHTIKLYFYNIKIRLNLHTLYTGAWLQITHLLSYINLDFTLPRVITCATRYVTILACLKFALGCSRNLMVYSRRFTPTNWPNRDFLRLYYFS